MLINGLFQGASTVTTRCTRLRSPTGVVVFSMCRAGLAKLCVVFINQTRQRIAVDASRGAAPAVIRDMAARVTAQARLLMPSIQVAHQAVLTDYDSYYYATH